MQLRSKSIVFALLVSLFVISGCDYHSAVTSEEAPPSIETLRKAAIDRGINPDHVDYEQMYKSGDFTSFTSNDAMLTGSHLQTIQRRWPEMMGRLRYAKAIENGTLSKTEASEEKPSDQDVCWGYGGYPTDPNAGSDYCECIRNPVTCDDSDPDDDTGSGGGGGSGDDDGSSDPQDDQNDEDQCRGVGQATP